MKQIITITILIFSCWQCKKKDAQGDLSGKEYIRGRLFINDTLTQQASGIALGKKKVFISYSGSLDSLNYLFNTTTDDAGYFIFQNLKKNAKYRIYYEDTIGNVIHEAIDSSYAPNDTMRLSAHVSLTKQNGIHLTVTDAVGGILGNANVCLFNSPVTIGYANNGCDGSNYKITSDAYGHAFKFSIPANTYYINSSIDIAGVTMYSKDTIAVGGQIKFDTVRLKPLNGMHFTVFDSLGTQMSGVSICVFTSLALYRQDTCVGSNFQLSTGINGETTKYNLAANTYYIYSTYISGSFIWVARDTISLTNQIVNHSLIMRKKR